MESNKLMIGLTRGELGGYVSSEKSSSECPRSGSSSSPTSTTGTNFTETTYVNSKDTLNPKAIAPPGSFIEIGSNVKYATAEVRVMADTVAQARKTSELPPTQSSTFDAQAIIEDYTLLAQLRLARGDPALPPPEEYTRLRVEVARRIRERDARLGDEECKQAAAERVEGYLKVVGQERRYYDLARTVAKGRGGDRAVSEGAERLMDEIVAVMERKILDGSGGLRDNFGRIGTTADVLDSTADIFDAVACSLGGTARTLSTATASLNTTTSTLENTLGVMATQISTLNSQLLALTDILQSQRSPATPASPTPHAKLGSPHQAPQPADLALEDSVRRGIAQAVREIAPHIQMARSSEISSVESGLSSRTRALWDESCSDTASDYTAVEGKTKHRRGGRRDKERKTRRAGKYMRIVIDRILR